MLKVTNYGVWSTFIGRTLQEKKQWQHAIGTALRPLVARVATPTVGDVAAPPRVDAVAGAAETI